MPSFTNLTTSKNRYNVCIMAYGQTGSGKTTTMEGTPSEPGINPRYVVLLSACLN